MKCNIDIILSLHLCSEMRKALSISLLMLFITATIGVTVSKHFCGGKLADTSLFSAASCGCGDKDMEGNCCSNESEFFQMDEDYIITSADIDFKLKFTLAFLSAFIDSFFIEEYNSSDYSNYKPPLLNSDIPILVQSFLL